MSEVNKNISVNDGLLKLAKKPMKMDEFSSIERYFNALHDSFLIDFVNVGWYYDKNLYDFYFILEDTTTKWSKKIIMKKTMVDLIIKYRVIEFLIIKHYTNHDLILVEND